MKSPPLQRRQVSGLVFLLFVALLAFLFSLGPLKSWFETERQMQRLEQLVTGQRAIIARSAGSQAELDRLGKSAAFQEQLLQGGSLNMAITEAQGALTGLVEKSGGKILRVANVTADGNGSLKPVITSVNFECDDQDLNDILYAIEFGTTRFIVDHAEVRLRRASSRSRTPGKANVTPASTLTVRIDVRGFWQQTSDTDG